MPVLKCLVVDDEELARDLLRSHIEKIPYLELSGSYANPLEALDHLKTEPIDIVFLDIQMPEIKGVALAKLLPKTVKVIFTTAYAEYALEGFEVSATDYLLKPITFERFLKAVEKIGIDPSEPDPVTSLTVKSGYDLYKVQLQDISYIESDSEYVVYHTEDKKILSNQSLTALEKQLSNSGFIRVHRSFLVNKSKVDGMQGRDLLIGQHSIPVSDSYYKRVRKEIFMS